MDLQKSVRGSRYSQEILGEKKNPLGEAMPESSKNGEVVLLGKDMECISRVIHHSG